MLDLAQRGPRQVVNEDNVARYLEACKLRPDMSLQFFGVDLAFLSPDYIGDRHLIPARVYPSDHATFADIRMFEQDALDFCGVDIFATGNDEVFLAVVDPEISVGIAPANVAGTIPAIVQRFASRLIVPPIFAEYVRTAHRNLSRRLGGELFAHIIDYGSLAAEPRQTGRTFAAEIAAQPRIDCNRTSFGRPIDLQHRHAARDKALDQVRGHNRGPGRHCLQRGQVSVRPRGMVSDRLDDGRHQHR